MNGKLSALKPATFYTIAARFRITSYHNLGGSLQRWRSWIYNQGPILTRLDVDKRWERATATNGHLREYRERDRGNLGGHAVCLVGYTPDYFIVRNSWGTSWGDKGYAYASNAYAKKAFTEAYGAVL